MLTEEQRPAAPLVPDGLPSPVFVDGSGVRRAWTVRVLIGVATVCAAYLLVLGVGMLGGATPGALLPWPSATASTGSAKAPRPAERVAPAPAAPSAAPVPGPRRPAPPSPRIPSPAVPAPVPPPSAPAPAPTSSPLPPAPSVSTPPPAAPTTAPDVTRGRSDSAPGHLKRTAPPPSSTRKPRPASSPTPSPTG
jgi:hypothetical protein